VIGTDKEAFLHLNKLKYVSIEQCRDYLMAIGMKDASTNPGFAN
jgi:hypothetical protein